MTEYGTRLAAIRASAAAAGVRVVVDLHGALVDLRLERRAMARPARELADLIRRLAGEAGADALRQGQEVLGELLPAEPGSDGELGDRSGRRPPERDSFLSGGELGDRSGRRPPGQDSFLPATWAT
ncbi:hypothetical protein [Amycolatopsis sp. CA-128772]|uniref:hypothetical protein n=1 Tax=Amycolatopsis sp. CA-128772 TaxID=2073159 RepID=UPI000CD190DA|nr:hypothetical protein [Amycolatopsis sp. CA-128772]